MKNVIASSLIALSLTACVGTEGDRDLDTEDDRIVGTATLISILGWVGAEAGSFVAGEIFSLALPGDSADLSAEALAEIEKIVQTTVRAAALTEYNGELNGVAEEFNRYSRAACESVDDTPDCSVTELNQKRDDAQAISASAVRLYEVYRSWVSETDETVATDADWQVFLAGNARLAMTLDLAMLREVYEIETIQRLGTAQNTWGSLQSAAGGYLDDMSSIQSGYNEISAKFQNPRVISEIKSVNDGTSETWKGCFDAPEGVACGSLFREEGCFGEFGICSFDNASSTEAELQAEAEKLMAERKATFERLALGSQADFDKMKTALTEVKNRPWVAPPAAEPESCSTVSVSGSAYADRTTGSYKLDGELNGHPLYRFGEWSISRAENGFWGLYNEAGIRVDYGLDQSSSTAIEADWKTGDFVCAD